jgi:hypothetical protein
MPPTASPPTIADDGRGHNRDDRGHRRLPWGVIGGNYGWPYSYGWTDPWSSYPPDSYTGTRGPDNDYSNPVQLPPNANDVQPAQPVAPAPAQPPGSSVNTAAAQTANAVERSPELATANAAVQRAQADYDAAVQAVRDKLQQNPDYERAIEKRKQAEQQVQGVRHVDPGASPAEVAPAAQAKLEAGDEVTRLEAAAIAADPTAAAAKIKLQDAVTKRDALRNQLLAQHQRGG